MSKFELYLESCGCKGKCSDCECDKKYTRQELADELGIDVSEVKTNSVKGRPNLWIVDGKTYRQK